jgi:hypothetical protein
MGKAIQRRFVLQLTKQNTRGAKDQSRFPAHCCIATHYVSNRFHTWLGLSPLIGDPVGDASGRQATRLTNYNFGFLRKFLKDELVMPTV